MGFHMRSSLTITVGIAACECRKARPAKKINSETTIMKKLFSLALIAIVAFVAGCNKAADTSTTPSTNAPAAPAK